MCHEVTPARSLAALYMDALPLLAAPGRHSYRCPGEDYDIDRAVHLGRLAEFYPGCRECAHRGEVTELSSEQRQQWAELDSRRTSGPRFTAEGLESSSPGDIDRPTVQQFSTALAIALWRGAGEKPKPPVVVVGNDGNWASAELLSTACEALQWAGCAAVEAGATTSASLASVTHQLRADAAIWLGNASGRPHAFSLKVLGTGGQPWSSPGGLDRVQEIYDSRPARPKRHGGGLRRASADEVYLKPLESLFHALRPLRFVVDTASAPLLGCFERLASDSACELVRPQRTQMFAQQRPTADTSFLARRVSLIGQQVVEEGAHFGLWIDGDAESCHAVDERGLPVDIERMFWMMATYVCREQSQPTMVLEADASSDLNVALEQLGVRVIRSRSTRESMSAAIASSDAIFGGGPSGRFWYSGQPPLPDALMTLSLLLTMLSQSDRPISAVLDSGCGALYK